MTAGTPNASSAADRALKFRLSTPTAGVETPSQAAAPANRSAS
jgi:hypothetical protein